MKILIIEDESMIAKSLQRVFTREGHSTTWTSSGRKGLNLIQNHGAWDYLFLDLMIPDFSGIQIIQHLFPKDTHEGFTYPLLPEQVIVMTAFGNPQLKQLVKQHGLTKIILKPFKNIHDPLKFIEPVNYPKPVSFVGSVKSINPKINP